jgi:uncharacterized membrane protein
MKAAITINRSPEDVQRLWQSAPHPSIDEAGASVTFTAAPGDRGTEVHVDVDPPGGLGGVVSKITGAAPLARAKDELRHFKQRVETGEVARSEAVPEGESAERKLKERPAQPLSEGERLQVGV